jgi:hypothetical protein
VNKFDVLLYLYKNRAMESVEIVLGGWEGNERE